MSDSYMYLDLTQKLRRGVLISTMPVNTPGLPRIGFKKQVEFSTKFGLNLQSNLVNLNSYAFSGIDEFPATLAVTESLK